MLKNINIKECVVWCKISRLPMYRQDKTRYLENRWRQNSLLFNYEIVSRSQATNGPYDLSHLCPN